jgi:hypothetical protein
MFGNEQTTDGTDSVTSTADSGTTAANVTYTQPPQASQPTGLNPDIWAPDGKRWKDKYHGRDGAIAQLQQEKEVTRGQLETKIDSLSQTILEKDGQVEKLNVRLKALEEEAGTIPTLLEQLSEKEKEAGLAAKYRLLAEYPRLLEIQVDEEVPVEGQEEPTIVRVNPFLNLVEHTNLDGDALRAEIQRLSKFFDSQMQAAQQVQQGDRPPAPTTPAPAAPAEDTRESLYRKAMSLKQQMIEGGTDMLSEADWAEFHNTWDQIRKFDRAS